MNCWNAKVENTKPISSQAKQECLEGSETRSWSPDRTVKAHECAATNVVKTCNECNEEKGLGEFHKDKNCKFGVRNKCKKCAIARSQANYKANEADRVAKRRERYIKGREKHLEYMMDYRSRPGKKELQKQLRTRWNEENRDRYAANQRRNYIAYMHRKGQASPPWADRQYIVDLHRSVREANDLFEQAGISPKFEIDHIVPLKHDRVSGLHVEFNLQVLTKYENILKRNSFSVG